MSVQIPTGVTATVNVPLAGQDAMKPVDAGSVTVTESGKAFTRVI